MKKILIILLSLIVMVSMVSCGTDKTEEVSDRNNQIEAVDANTDHIILNQLGTGEIVINEPGIYQADETGEFNGNIIIKCSDVTIRDTKIIGDLTLHEDVGEGNTYIDNVSVEGINYVNGGGINSFQCSLVFIPRMYIKKTTSPVRIVAKEDTVIEEVVATTSSIIEVGDDSSSINNLQVETDNPDSEIDIRGNISNVEVKKQSNINIEGNSNIDNFAIDETAGGTRVSGDGNIDTIIIDADDVNIETDVENMYSNNEETEFTYYGDKIIPPHYNKYTDGGNTDDDLANNDGQNNDEQNNNDQNNNDNQADVPKDNNQEDNNKESSNQPNDESQNDEQNEDPNQGKDLLPVEFQFINEGYENSADGTYSLTVRLSEPCIVYYVFEDISVMMGSSYSPSNAQVKNGYNCFGQPNPKPFPEGLEDDEGNPTKQEFPPEALMAGTINVTEADKDYTVVINDPRANMPDDDENPGPNLSPVLHVVAVNSQGEEIRN